MIPQVMTNQEKSEAKTKTGFTITVDLTKCIAAGPCAAISPSVFSQRDSDDKAIIVDPDSDTIENIIDAAKSCPILAIIIKDKEGKQIFP